MQVAGLNTLAWVSFNWKLILVRTTKEVYTGIRIWWNVTLKGNRFRGIPVFQKVLPSSKILEKLPELLEKFQNPL